MFLPTARYCRTVKITVPCMWIGANGFVLRRTRFILQKRRSFNLILCMCTWLHLETARADVTAGDPVGVGGVEGVGVGGGAKL